ncbi:MAG: NAD-dependent epimerase/dehydratase [Gallionella sp.]
MRILITGGFGFIGGRLGQHLQQAGHQIVLGSRNASSPPDWLTQTEVVKTDWNESRALEQICNGVDVVIHAAGMNIQDCAADPVAALEFNGLATARLVAAASRAGVKRFLYLSTAHVYANPLIGTITEDTCPRNMHPYAASHLAGENVVLSAGQRGQIEGIVLRLSNVIGAPAHKDVNCWMLLVNDLCRQAVQSGQMLLRSRGLQSRDFISIAEICRVIDYFSSHDFDSADQGVFNVGSGVSQSVLEMAKLIQQRCKLVLGFEPELLRPEKGADDKHEMLEFRPSRLAKMGVNIVLDNNLEIDKLLAFCQASYSQNRSEGV